uniref:Protein FRG1 n=1 Tax=Rhabditophanes sp. KR3021 TaxID=114890 RepID=A0AC35TJE1_9BILA
MSSDYGRIKKGGFKLKGGKTLSSGIKKKGVVKKEPVKVDVDAEGRGGWRRLGEDLDLNGGDDIAIECGDYSKCYLLSQDNGQFRIGPQHLNGEGPEPEETFTLIKSPDDSKFCMKSGYGKYIGINGDGLLVATAEAMGDRERFELITENGKTAIQSSANGLFLRLCVGEGVVKVTSKKVTDGEIVNVRTNCEKKGPVQIIPQEDLLNSGDCEASYIKMYQHSKVDLKNRHICVDVKDKKDITAAKKTGTLHATLLDRRMKTKSDRYC